MTQTPITWEMVGAVLGVAAVIAAAWWKLYAINEKKIGDVDARHRENHAEAKSEINNLHERVNRVREEFVRRDDLDKHMGRIDASITDMRADMRTHSEKTEARLTDIFTALTKRLGAE